MTIDNFSNIVIIVILICPGFLLIFCDVFYITSIIIICLYSKFILNLLASLADLRWPLRCDEAKMRKMDSYKLRFLARLVLCCKPFYLLVARLVLCCQPFDLLVVLSLRWLSPKYFHGFIIYYFFFHFKGWHIFFFSLFFSHPRLGASGSPNEWLRRRRV